MTIIIVSKFSNVGQISAYIADYLPPGWLPMDGETRQKSNYPELFSVIPSEWKDGDDFTLPDTAGFKMGGNQKIAALVNNTPEQVIATDTPTKLNWNTEQFDFGGLHDISLNNSRLTAPYDGLYFVELHLVFTSPFSTYDFEAYLLKNNTPGIPYYSTSDKAKGSLVIGEEMIVNGLYNLVAGDYIEAVVLQMSGNNQVVANSSNFSIIRQWGEGVNPTWGIYAGR